jgi:hypothetical protein
MSVPEKLLILLERGIDLTPLSVFKKTRHEQSRRLLLCKRATDHNLTTQIPGFIQIVRS